MTQLTMPAPVDSLEHQLARADRLVTDLVEENDQLVRHNGRLRDELADTRKLLAAHRYCQLELEVADPSVSPSDITGSTSV